MVGDTPWLPLVAVEIVQPLGDVALQEVALAEDHVSVEDWPDVVVVGLAVRETVGVWAEPTVTVALAGVLPPEPVQVIV